MDLASGEPSTYSVICLQHRVRTARASFVAATAVAAVLAMPSASFAGPIGGSVVGGSANISQAGSTTNINQSSANAIINWQGFSVGKNETVNFNQPSSQAATLNRVIGNETSVISGALNANGHVFIVNSAGVIFTKNAQVNVGGLVASTLDIANADFMAGKYNFSGTSGASIINKGTLHAHDGGFIALLGKTVSNDGVITARLGTVAMASGNKITLNFNGDSLVDVTIDQGTLNALVQNKRAIIADGGQVIMTAKAADQVLSAQVNNTGLIQARTMAALKGGDPTGKVHIGKIKLVADGGTVNVSGKLDASAPKGGNGGTIETSGNTVKVADGTVVTTKAAKGQTGTWTIDPDGFTVAASGGDISGTTLSGLLGMNNITLSSTMGTGTDGNLNVNDTISWAANTILTLNATNNININAPITATGATAGLVLNYGGYNGTTVTAPTTGTSYNINNGASVTLSGANATLGINGQAYTLIHTMDQLAAISRPGNDPITGAFIHTASGYYALAQDLSPTSDPTSNYNFTGPVVSALTGTLTGLGHTITGLAMNEDPNLGGYTALIGLVGSSNFGGTIVSTAIVRDIGIVSPNITAPSGQAGALVAQNFATVSNDWVSGGTITSSGGEIGGLVGANDGGTIVNSFASGGVTAVGFSFIGGLVGLNYNHGAVINSYASNVSVSGVQSVGGLVGENFTGSTVVGSYATGSVTSQSSAGSAIGLGGLVGTNSGSIANSHAGLPGVVMVNLVGGSGTAGGLVGTNSGSISNSYADGDITATNSSGIGGLVGSNSGTIVSSYAIGNVTVTENSPAPIQWSGIGGLVGGNAAGSISNSFAAGNVLVLGTQPVTYVGGLVGQNQGSISGSVAVGGFVTAANGRDVGGLAGSNMGGGSISNSAASDNVTGFADVGGLVGLNSGSTITGSVASGNVTATGPNGNGNAGGLVGENGNTTSFSTGAVSVGTISGSAASGNVTGPAGADIGGLLGYNNGGAVSDSAASGNVTVVGTATTGAAGGLIGFNSGGTVSHSTATGDVSGPGTLGAFAGINTGSIDHSLATGEVNGGPGSFDGADSFTSPFTHFTTRGTVTNSIYHDVKAEARAAQQAAAEQAAAAAQEAQNAQEAQEERAQQAARARALQQAAVQAGTIGNVAGTTNTQMSATVPPRPSMSTAGTRLIGSITPPALDDQLTGATEEQQQQVQPFRRTAATKPAGKASAHGHGPGYGASIRSIEINGQRFDLQNGNGQKSP